MLDVRLMSHANGLNSAYKMGYISVTGMLRYTMLIVTLLLMLQTHYVTSQDVQSPNIQASRINKDGLQENRDLTVLLVNDQNKQDTKIGRYHTVKPIIGLLTSTARTFIQDGVTTEFATQILGTTLDNGRIYAQLLTKSSLVIYSKPSRVDDDIVKTTKLVDDNKWNVNQDIGLDSSKYILKNTDYLQPNNNKMFTVFASKPNENDVYSWSNKDEEDNIIDNLVARRVLGNVANTLVENNSNNLDNPFDFRPINEPNILNNVNSLHRYNKNYDSLVDIVSSDKQRKNNGDIVASKVKPDTELPTFTIKNEFSPIFYYIDNVETKSPYVVDQVPKVPKKLFGPNIENRHKKTFTYVGFADFTTEVGDTVIVFTPNTERAGEFKPGQVNILPSVKPSMYNHKITSLSGDILLPTQVFKPEKRITPTAVYEDKKTDKEFDSNEDNFKNVNYDDSLHSNINDGSYNLDVIQSSEVSTTTDSSSYPEELEIIPLQKQNQATEPLNTVIKSSNTRITDWQQSFVEKNPEITTESESLTESYENTEENTETITTLPESEENLDEPENENLEPICTAGLTPVSTMTTELKTLTYLTTYFIPLEDSGTTTSVKSDIVIQKNTGYTTNFKCNDGVPILPSSVASNTLPSIESSIIDTIKQGFNDEAENSTQSEGETTEKSSSQSDVRNKVTDVSSEETTTKKSRDEVNYSTEYSVTTENNDDTTTKSPQESSAEESDNEIDLIYKTLYTTYTYFTTFFQGDSTKIASQKSIVTNVITKTIDFANVNPSLLDMFNQKIEPTSILSVQPTNDLNSVIDLYKNKNLLDSAAQYDGHSTQLATPALDDSKLIKPDSVKTLYTTYTFYTTIYVGQDANICSRSEIYTNYIGPESLLPTKTEGISLMSTAKKEFDFRACKRVPAINLSQTSGDLSINKTESGIDEHNPSPVEVDMLFSVEAKPIENESSYVTDVKSSSSRGDRKIIENNNLFDDQISSETNLEEISPSPTLLLQTSYTTFTYFTTMYVGKDSSNVKSHLETITNIVTETIAPKNLEPEESNLPITYYTTFTYWTTLYKDKMTTITSREEVISNVVQPTAIPQKHKNESISPIDTSPIDIEAKPSTKALVAAVKPTKADLLNEEEEKATFYTTYTYFTTFYVGNTSQIRSSLETITNVVEGTKDPTSDNQLGRAVGSKPASNNLIENNEKLEIKPTVMEKTLQSTKLVNPSEISDTNIDNVEIPNPIKENKKVLFSQVAVISGDSTIITDGVKSLNNSFSNITTDSNNTSFITPASDVIESSVTEPAITQDPSKTDDDTNNDEEIDDEDGTNTRKKSRLTFSTKTPTFTPVIRPFSSRNRPTFSPKRIPLTGGATTITRVDFTPTITATPTLKSTKSGFGQNRKAIVTPSFNPSSGRRFVARNSITGVTSPQSSSRSFGRVRPSAVEINPSSRRLSLRTSQNKNNIDFASRSPGRIRPTPTLKLRNPKPTSTPLQNADEDDINKDENEQDDQTENENSTEVTTESQTQKPSNPLLRFRRPLTARQPSAAVTTRAPLQTTKKTTLRGRVVSSSQRPTTKASSPPPYLRSRTRNNNALFPRRNLFKQPEPEQEEQPQEVDMESIEEVLEDENSEDSDFGSSDREEQQISTSSTQKPKKTNRVEIRPFQFRRIKRQANYGSRKYSNFRRPKVREVTKQSDEEKEVETSTQKPKISGRFTPRGYTSTRASTSRNSRQPFILRGESRTTTTTTSVPSYRVRSPRPVSRTTTSRPRTSRISSFNSQNDRKAPNSRASSRTKTKGNIRNGSRFRTNNDYNTDNNHFTPSDDDGKITVTHHIPTEVTIPIVNGKITEYKNVLTAKPSLEVLLPNQYSKTVGPLGNTQLVLASESTQLGENGATKVIKYYLHETPTKAIVFTPTTLRGRKTSFSHIVPSTVYNVEPMTSTIQPDINPNVPLANILLSQLLLGNVQQQQINPLLALQGQGLLQQQPIAQTPVTELKTRPTTYVTTVTDARETVLPITFRGKEKLTTIVNPTVNVITATEFITETIITTPTNYMQNPQLNSLLLLLQQQQQQNAAASLQTTNPLFGLSKPELQLIQKNALNNDLISNENLYDIDSIEKYEQNGDSISEDDYEEDLPPPTTPKIAKAKPKAKATNVVTLYVSGRMPGEFSTVLSTIVSDEAQSKRKREALVDNYKLYRTYLPTIGELYSSNDNDLDNAPLLDIQNLDNSIESQLKTDSLESIIGEVGKNVKLTTDIRGLHTIIYSTDLER